MYLRVLFCLTISIVIAMGGQVPAKPTALTPKEVDAIVQTFESSYVAAFNRGDAKAISGLYTENATVLAEGGGLQLGRAHIAGALANLFTTPYGSISDKPLYNTAVTNDVIVAQGIATRTRVQPPLSTPVLSYYSKVLVRQNDHWLLAAIQYAVPFSSHMDERNQSKDPRTNPPH